MSCTRMIHSSHRHELIKRNNSQRTYWCKGCKQQGCDTRFSCENCNYHLHEYCASPSNSLFHPHFKNGELFKFLERAPGPHTRYCRACGKAVEGYGYHCHKTKDDLHPVCANLPLVLQFVGAEVHLKKKISKKCGECGRRGTMIPSGGSWTKVNCWSLTFDSTNNEEYHIPCLTEIIMKLRRENCPELERNSLAMEILRIPYFHLARASAGTSRQLSNWTKLKTIANILCAFIFGGHAGGIAALAASMLSNSH